MLVINDDVTLDELQISLKAKARELLSAKPEEMAVITLELQRLRVACLVYREVEAGFADPNTYREVNLLNRMMTGKDMEEDFGKKEEAVSEADAVEVMNNMGLSRESAHRIAKAMASVRDKGKEIGAMEEPDDGEFESPERVKIRPTRDS